MNAVPIYKRNSYKYKRIIITETYSVVVVHNIIYYIIAVVLGLSL